MLFWHDITTYFPSIRKLCRRNQEAFALLREAHLVLCNLLNEPFPVNKPRSIAANASGAILASSQRNATHRIRDVALSRIPRERKLSGAAARSDWATEDSKERPKCGLRGTTSHCAWSPLWSRSSDFHIPLYPTATKDYIEGRDSTFFCRDALDSFRNLKYLERIPGRNIVPQYSLPYFYRNLYLYNLNR